MKPTSGLNQHTRLGRAPVPRVRPGLTLCLSWLLAPLSIFSWSLVSSWSPSSDTLSGTWTRRGLTQGRDTGDLLKPPGPLDDPRQLRPLLCDRQSIPGHVGQRDPHAGPRGPDVSLPPTALWGCQELEAAWGPPWWIRPRARCRVRNSGVKAGGEYRDKGQITCKSRTLTLGPHPRARGARRL